MKNTILFFLSLLFVGSLMAQQTPAAPQTQPILITGATAHLGNGIRIENSFIAFEQGKITIVADARTVNIDNSKNYKIIDASGKHVYPGFIAPNTNLGLVEIGAVRSTRDFAEVGQLNPSIRSIIAYNTDSRVTPTVRSNGVLMAQVTPQGGRVSGQSSVVVLDAWNWEDAAYRTDDGIHLNWPRVFTRRWGGTSVETSKNKNYAEQIRAIEDLFKEAQAYVEKQKVDPKNLKLEAMRGLFDQSKNLYVHTQDAKTIMEATLLAEQFGMRIVIVGGRDSWMITDFVKEHQVPVILRQSLSLPGRIDADIDQPYKTAKLLQEAGILFAFSVGGGWQQRNLPFHAGHSVAFGLDYEAAISGLTLNTAKILGVDKTTGSIEKGKDASLFICEGDALDMRTCKVVQAFIQGREIDLDNKQKALYRKFQDKYGE
ncbi:MAG: amidohydrolase family protein [Bacteroidota bacterium]